MILVHVAASPKGLRKKVSEPVALDLFAGLEKPLKSISQANVATATFDEKPTEVVAGDATNTRGARRRTARTWRCAVGVRVPGCLLV